MNTNKNRDTVNGLIRDCDLFQATFICTILKCEVCGVCTFINYVQN